VTVAMGKKTPSRQLVKTRLLSPNLEAGKKSITKRSNDVMLPFSQ